jgi:hypothetical protein
MKTRSRRWFLKYGTMLIAIAGAAIIAGYEVLREYHPISTTSSPTTTSVSSSYSQDYLMFVMPYLDQIRKLGKYLMTPYSGVQNSVGYDSTRGLLRGANYCGNGYRQDYGGLIDYNLTAGIPLDYWNNGSTTIESTVRNILATGIFEPAGDAISGCSTSADVASGWKYPGNDRRELLFGTRSPYFEKITEIYQTMGNAVLQPASPPFVPIEVMDTSTGDTTASSSEGMNTYVPKVLLAYISGNITEAKEWFASATNDWNGCAFPSHDTTPFNTRTLCYYLIMARATKFWTLDANSTNVAKEVSDAMWANQNNDGSMSVSYTCPPPPSLGRTSGEPCGLALLASDPRLPSWFP